jgi:hypothetical protein
VLHIRKCIDGILQKGSGEVVALSLSTVVILTVISELLVNGRTGLCGFFLIADILSSRRRDVFFFGSEVWQPGRLFQPELLEKAEGKGRARRECRTSVAHMDECA